MHSSLGSWGVVPHAFSEGASTLILLRLPVLAFQTTPVLLGPPISTRGPSPLPGASIWMGALPTALHWVVYAIALCKCVCLCVCTRAHSLNQSVVGVNC